MRNDPKMDEYYQQGLCETDEAYAERMRRIKEQEDAIKKISGTTDAVCVGAHGRARMTTNHEHLREVAEKATPIYTDLLGDRYFNDDYSHVTLNVQQDDFIRAFSPTTAIALLDELAALRKENEGMRAVVMDILKLADEHRAGGYRIFQVMTDCPLIDAARAAIGDSHE